MASELPYFRFTVQDWQNGKITLESYELQGLFISVCGYYWINDCSVTLAILKKKFSNATLLLDNLIELGILKHENRHDKIEIEFLNIQYDLLSEKRKRRQDAGSKGGNAKAMLKQNDGYKDKDNNKDKIISEYPFSSFWDLYGKKVGREKAEKKYNSLSEEDKSKIINTLPVYIKNTPEIKFRKDPLTYLNGKHWNDEVVLVNKSTIKTFSNGKTVDISKFKPGVQFTAEGEPFYQ